MAPSERTHLHRAEAVLLRLRWLGMASWFLILDPARYTAPTAVVHAIYGASIAYTAATHWHVRRARAVRAGAVATTVLDGLVVAAICAVTGGLGSDFYPYFYLTTLATSIRFGIGPALAVLALNALLSAALFAAAPSSAGQAPALRGLGLRIFYLCFATILGGLLAGEARRNLRLAQTARDRSRELLWRLIRAQEDERKRVAGELHDRMGTRFFELHVGVDRCRELLDGGDPRAASLLERLGADARACGAEIRTLMDELRPSVLDDFGIREAVLQFGASMQQQGQQDGLALSLAVDPDAASERPEVNAALFRILQEAALNARKHAGAQHLAVELRREEGDRLALIVRDDGRGFDPGASVRGHYGLLTMRERVEACGGTLEIESAPGRGTTLRAVVPAAPGPPDAKAGRES